MRPTPEPIIMVYGDSLSCPIYSLWKQLEKHWACNVMVHARGGLKLTELHIPSWVSAETMARWEPSALVVYLGTNDALKDKSATLFEAKLINTCSRMIELQYRSAAAGDYLDLYIIKPPSYSYDRNIARKMAAYRDVFKTVEKEFEAWDINFLNLPWGDYKALEDRYHPNKTLHGCQAAYLATEWQLEQRPS